MTSLDKLLDLYSDIRFSEGREGVSPDMVSGAASAARQAIEDEFARLQENVAMLETAHQQQNQYIDNLHKQRGRFLDAFLGIIERAGEGSEVARIASAAVNEEWLQ